jgi:hypothetical protein
MTIYFAPKLGITTNGREASLSEAKEQFLRNWQKCRTDSIPASRRDVSLGFVEPPDQKAADARTPSDVPI